MALIQMEFKSEALKRTVPVNVILPIEKFKGPFPQGGGVALFGWRGGH